MRKGSRVKDSDSALLRTARKWGIRINLREVTTEWFEEQRRIKHDRTKTDG